jgi:hypothetical protein
MARTKQTRRQTVKKSGKHLSRMSARNSFFGNAIDRSRIRSFFTK